MAITEKQRLFAESKIYNSPQKFIDLYENGDENVKEFMILITLASSETVREIIGVLDQELAERAKGQATE